MTLNDLEKKIVKFVANYGESQSVQTRWRTPLVGTVSAQDARVVRLKNAVRETHLLPQDLMMGAQTVVAFFIPFDDVVVKSNIKGEYCSMAWATAYLETNNMIGALSDHLKALLSKAGYNAATIPATHNFDEKRLIFNWSHRHFAVLAGLGRFGLNNMVITKVGACGRCGTLVTDLVLPATAGDNKEKCLYLQRGICGACVARCVNHALTKDGFDRHKCYDMCLKNDAYYANMPQTDVCGKCMVGVPCATKSPI